MAKYEYLHALVTSCGKEQECLLKKTVGKEQAFVEMPAINTQTGKRVIIFPKGEVRTLGNEPLAEHLCRWYKEALVGQKQRELKEVKEFFKNHPSFWKRIRALSLLSKH